jgi:glutamyl-tRNA synthetase
LGSLSISELRDDGLEPMAINSLLGRLGTSEAVQAVHHLDDLVATFDIGHFGRGTPKFDVAELHHLNARLLHDLPYSVAKPRLQSLDIHADEDFWLAVRGNLGHFREASDWWRICRATVSPTIEDAGLCAEAATLLPGEPWNGETWKTWTQSVAAATGRTGRALYHPLRLALTGRADGPELKTLLPLIGRARSLARLNGHAA